MERVEKPWGWEEIWARTDRYVGKILHINAGEKLSLQFHEIKDETIRVMSGAMALYIQEDGERGVPRMKLWMTMEAGQTYRIEPGVVHRMEAITECEVVEVSTPELDDVVRLEDKYGRVKRIE